MSRNIFIWFWTIPMKRSTELPSLQTNERFCRFSGTRCRRFSRKKICGCSTRCSLTNAITMSATGSSECSTDFQKQLLCLSSSLAYCLSKKIKCPPDSFIRRAFCSYIFSTEFRGNCHPFAGLRLLAPVAAEEGAFPCLAALSPAVLTVKQKIDGRNQDEGQQG